MKMYKRENKNSACMCSDRRELWSVMNEMRAKE